MSLRALLTTATSSVLKSQSGIFPTLPVILLIVLAVGIQAAVASDNMTGIFNSTPEKNMSTVEDPSGQLDNTTNTTLNRTLPIDTSNQTEAKNNTLQNRTNTTSPDENITEPEYRAEQPEEAATKTQITIQSPQETTYETGELWGNATLNKEGTVYLSLDGASRIVLVNSSGNWNGLLSLLDGDHTAVFSAIDASGNPADQVPVSFTVDTSSTEEAEDNETIDSKPPIYSLFGTDNSTPEVGSLVEFHALWRDNFGLDTWTFSSNISGTWVNESKSFVSSYAENTQILVKGGWKYMRDLTYEDEVATLNGDKVEYEKPIRIIELPYDNGVYNIDGDIDLVVTEDHKVYTRIDGDVEYAFNIFRDRLFGPDTGDFVLVEIDVAYKLSRSGSHLTFLGEDLQPMYVKKVTREHYTGKIYDLTVPNHIVLVKGGGEPVWSSNQNIKESWSSIRKIAGMEGTVGFRFYAHDLFDNWNQTPIAYIAVTPPPTEEQNKSDEIIPSAPAQGGISYDSDTNTIFVIGNGVDCTFSSPCKMADIYNATSSGSWGTVENSYNYYAFNSRLQVGDGINETWLYSELEHVYITRPWEVMPNAKLQFGNVTEEGIPGLGTLFETDVPGEQQLDSKSALKVHSGGELAFYESVYKVQSSGENNIYQEEGSRFDSKRFDIERTRGDKTSTTMFIPTGSNVEDFRKGSDVSIDCTEKSKCTEILEVDKK